jgi:hypothetical protein
MNIDVVGRVALLLALIAPVQSYAASVGGLDENTAPPTVIVPPTTPAPQTPASPPSPIAVDNFSNFAPLFQSRQFHATGGRGR